MEKYFIKNIHKFYSLFHPWMNNEEIISDYSDYHFYNHCVAIFSSFQHKWQRHHHGFLCFPHFDELDTSLGEDRDRFLCLNLNCSFPILFLCSYKAGAFGKLRPWEHFLPTDQSQEEFSCSTSNNRAQISRCVPSADIGKVKKKKTNIFIFLFLFL